MCLTSKAKGDSFSVLVAIFLFIQVTIGLSRAASKMSLDVQANNFAAKAED